ncbi:MAG TPA: hypothetical protein PKK60_00050 [archaeon]|nr:hypothetical protein [archaeon]
MVRKRGLFKVVGHGDGPSARKGIALALKKQEGRLVVSVEKQFTQYQKELRSRGVHTKPGNLVVLERTDSVDFLAKQAAHTKKTNRIWLNIGFKV